MKLFYDKKKKFPASQSKIIFECMKFIEESLVELCMDKQIILKTIMFVEETVSQLIEHTDITSHIVVRVRKVVSNVQISVSSRGVEYDPYQYVLDKANDLEKLEDEDVLEATRAIFIKAQGTKLKFSRKGQTNKIQILAETSERLMVLHATVALILGILFGFLMKYILPETLSSILSVNFFDPIKTMFMSALKIIVAPVVFFSIVSCFSQFKNISDLGRIGIKIVGMYLMTSIIAVFLSLGIFYSFRPGNFGCASNLVNETQTIDANINVNTSFRSMIVNIVPSNFIRPFLESDTLQLIFLAIICGIATGTIGEHSTILQNIFEAFNNLFITIAKIISRFIPILVFCSIAMLINNLDSNSFFAILAMIVAYVFAIFCMLAIYGILIVAIARLNPFIFFRKNRSGMLTSLMLSSSSASIPVNIKVCTDMLGISQKICNFSIPLGATLNMDGQCIFLTISGLFMARIYGVTVPNSSVFLLATIIIMLSMACPGVTGSGLVYLGIVLKNLDVPVEAMGLIIGIYPFLSMISTVCNTTGDVAATLIVARSEKMLDVDKYAK